MNLTDKARKASQNNGKGRSDDDRKDDPFSSETNAGAAEQARKRLGQRLVKLFEIDEHFGRGSAREFVDSVRPLAWGAVLSKLSEADIIVTSAELEEALKDGFEGLSCRFYDPYNGSIDELNTLTQTKGRLLLLLPKSERAIHRYLAENLPKRKIIPLLTELLPNSLHKPARLSWPTPPAKVEHTAASDKASPVIIIGTPGSEVSFFADLLARAGMGEVRPYFPKAISMFKSLEGEFPLARFMNTIETRFHEDGAFATYIYADIIADLLRTKVVTPQRMLRYLTERNVKIIYYVMRDKIRQAVYAEAFHARGFDSFWELPEKAQDRYRYPSLKPLRLTKRLLPLVEQDIQTDILVRQLPNVQLVNHEDLVLAPKEVLTTVSSFLERPLNVTTEVDWFAVSQSVAPNIEEDTASFARFVIDKLGLHANAAGSLVPLQKLVTDVIEERMEEQDQPGLVEEN